MVTAAVLALSACGSSGNDSSRVSAHRPEFQRALEGLTASGASGAVALVTTDAETWRGASGYANPGAKRRATVNDRFSIASITKTFVATVVLQLVGEGRLSLRDPVERWLPGEVRQGSRITIRQLLNHTSGVPNDSSFSASARDRIALLRGQPLDFPPGQMHSYSNANYVVLGLVVEKITATPLAEVIRDRIFRPLELEHTSYGMAPRPASDRAPAWLGAAETATDPSVSGDGGIVSTLDDLKRFYRALLGGELLRPAELTAMTRTVDTGLGDIIRAGLGLFRFRVPCGFAWGHAGDQPTYSAIALGSRDGSNVAVVAQNTSGWNSARTVAETLYCG